MNELPRIPKPPLGRVIEPQWPMAESVVQHLRGDGRWYELRGIDEQGNLLWVLSDYEAFQ